LKRSWRRKGPPWGFLPLADLFASVGILPFLTALADSFFRDVYGDRSFVGLSNFRFLFGDSAFALSALITLAWAGASTLVSAVVGYCLATLLHESKRAFRIVFLALLGPWAGPAFISVPIWRMLILSALFGIRVNLLSDPFASFAAALFVNGWMNAPAAVFVMYGALQSVPRSLAEAASLDGAKSAALSFSVWLPQVRPSLAAVAALEFVKAFKEFNLPFLFTAGGPPLVSGITRRTIIGATTTLEVYLYDLFRDSDNYGLAAAYATTLAVATGIVVALAFAVRKVSTRSDAEGKSPFRSAIPTSELASIGWRLSVNYVDSLLPRYFTTGNFRKVFLEDGLARTFLNTLFVSLSAALIMPFLALPAALSLGRAANGKQGTVFGIVQALGAVGGIHSLVPLYAIVRSMGLLDTYAPIVVVYLFHAAPYALFTTTAFIRRIPPGIEEAAEIEGAGPVRKFRSILLPLSLPAVATCAMASFLAAWNGFLVPLLFLNDDAKYTIGVRLGAYVGSIASGSPQWNRFAAASLINLLLVALVLFQFKKPLGNASIADHDE
jgi:multiple sugar transport system permease protein